MDFTKKPEGTISPSELLGFGVVIAPDLVQLSHVLNQVRCDGRKDVKIVHLHAQPQRLGGGMEFHVLIQASMIFEKPEDRISFDIVKGPEVL